MANTPANNTPTNNSGVEKTANPAPPSTAPPNKSTKKKAIPWCYELIEPVMYFSMSSTCHGLHTIDLGGEEILLSSPSCNLLLVTKTHRTRLVLLSVDDPNILQDLPTQRQRLKKPEPNPTIQTRFTPTELKR
jgi:hypothetical protein